MNTPSADESTIKWHLACLTDDVPEDGGSCVLIDGHQIAVFHFKRDGQWFASDNLCPHRQQMALSRGMIGCTEGRPKVACPFHKKTFSLESGECLSGDEYRIQIYPVRISGNSVYIGIQS